MKNDQKMSGKLSKVFKTPKPVIGMLHIGNLLGTIQYEGVNVLVRKAKRDIKALQEGGIDAILIENYKETSLGEFVNTETVVCLTNIMDRIVKDIKVSFGFNILNNDYKVALSLSKIFKADFIQLDVFVDDVVSDFKNNIEAKKHPFKICVDSRRIKEYAKKIGAEDVPIFAFIQPKHYKLLNSKKTIEESAKQAEAAGAAGVLVTKETGIAPTLEIIQRVKSVVDIPVGIGSGFSIENAKEYLDYIDIAVVGTSVKKGGKTDGPVDSNRVKKLMSIVKAC